MKPQFTRDDVSEYDVVVLGSGLTAFSAGAILANEGRRVAIVDGATDVGASFGSTSYNGYWLPWGRRDGRGFGDTIIVTDKIDQVARRAGVDLKMRAVPTYFSRLHLLNDNPGVLEFDQWIWPVEGLPGAEAVAESMLRIVLPGEELDIRPLVTEFVATATALSMMDRAERHKRITTPLEQWLDERGVNLYVRQAMYQLMETQAHIPPSNASVGRLATRLQVVTDESALARVPADDEVGGLQGAVEMFRRRFEACGGELWLDWKPLEISLEEAVDGPEVTGVVAINQSNLVHRFRAPVVISEYEGWDLPELLDERLLPPSFMPQARAAQRAAQVDHVGWMAGLKRLPKRRGDKKAEDQFFHRFVGGNSSTFGYIGGFAIWSGFDPTSAPAGKHFMFMWNQRADNPRPLKSWAEIQKQADRILEYVFDYYDDLEACIEWSRYNYRKPPHGAIWRMCHTGHYHPLKVATVEGLYVASYTTETEALPMILELDLAEKAVELAQLERGHLWGSAQRPQPATVSTERA